jgi:hypothetical protein
MVVKSTAVAATATAPYRVKECATAVVLPPSERTRNASLWRAVVWEVAATMTSPATAIQCGGCGSCGSSNTSRMGLSATVTPSSRMRSGRCMKPTSFMVAPSASPRART